MYHSLVEAVQAHAKEFPERMAVADGQKSYTYSQLSTKVVWAAQRLGDYQVGQGDYVLVECTQNADYIVLDLACNLAGVVFVPLEKKMKLSRVKSMYEKTGAQCIFGNSDYTSVGRYVGLEEFWEGVDVSFAGTCPYVEKNPTAEILFTTGTTGEPKGIVLSHRANLAVAENILYGTQMHEGTVELVPLPLSHSHGLRTCYANLLNGSAVVIIDGVLNVALFFKMIEQYHVNAIDLSPTLAKLLMKIARKGLQEYSPSIEYMEIGTAFLEDEVKGGLKKIFPETRLYNFYGSTEAGRSCVLDFNREDFSGCIGRPSRNTSIFIVDENRKQIEGSKDAPGFLAVSGSMMMDGYFQSEELTKEVLENGILYTNDLGYRDSAGLVYVLGRKDDIINYKGIKIAPEEIEAVAVQYEGINDCACIAVDDAVCGQVPKLFVKLDEGFCYREEEYAAFLREHLESSRVPVYIEVTEYISRSSNGKLQRKKMREYEQKK